jgi:hypothetical protein
MLRHQQKAGAVIGGLHHTGAIPEEDLQSLAQGNMSQDILNAIKNVGDINGLDSLAAMSEREKIILTTTGSIFKKMMEKRKDLGSE